MLIQLRTHRSIHPFRSKSLLPNSTSTPSCLPARLCLSLALCLSLSLDLFSFVSPSPPDSIYPRLNTKPINHTTQPGHHPGRRHRLPYLSPPPRPHQPHTQQHQRQRRPRLSRSVPQQQQAADHVDRPRYLPVRRGREGDVGVDAGFVVGEGGGVVGDWG